MLRLSTAINCLLYGWFNLPCLENQTGRGSRREARLLRSCACRTDSWNTITALSGSAFEFLILSFPGAWAPMTWFRRRRRHSCLSIIDYYEAARLPPRNETKGEMKTASPLLCSTRDKLPTAFRFLCLITSNVYSSSNIL